MREIKFRAWDTQTKKLYNDIGGGSEEHRYTINQQFERYQKDGLWHLMQFTGLKDKNGKDVFEGDILMYPDTESEEVDVGIGMMKVAEQPMNSFWPVEFLDGEFGMNIKDGEIGHTGWISLKNLFADYVDPKEVEVIGNIYENDHLIV